MSNVFVKALQSIFTNKSKKALEKLYVYVHDINTIFSQLKKLTNDELRAKTQSLKGHIKKGLSPIQAQLLNIKESLEENSYEDMATKEALFMQRDELLKQENKKLKELLDEILPHAFAIIKETAHRFQSNQQLSVTAREYDYELAKNKKNVEIKKDKAIWHNQWQVIGNEITWDMIHYDVQLIGGIILHQGKIAEMATGEGKTLVATLAAFLNALSEQGVHIITVNDYLAKRDAEWMSPIYEFHGLSVDCIDKHLPNSPARRKAYQADITYGTNNEFGFDYLRDHLTTEIDEIVQRKHYYAIVDEVDSIFIDDARTPLIISGPVQQSNEEEYYKLKPKMQILYENQKKLVNQFLQEAKKLIENKEYEKGGLALFRAYRGLPKYKPLIKYLSEQGIKQILNKTENYYLQANERLMPEADEPLLFVIEEKNNKVELTEKGIHYISSQGEYPDLFQLPDLNKVIHGDAKVKNEQINIDEPIDTTDKKNQIIKEYTQKSKKIQAIHQLLKAYTLFEKDVEYVVLNHKVKIIDEQTGRILEGRRYADGLHQALEAKENVQIEKASQTYATITLQNYFLMYNKLAGMTGTAETEASEFWSIYKLEVIVAPTNKKMIREDKQDKVYKTTKEKFSAILEEIIALYSQGRPVLVGTTSVEISELVNKMLKLRRIPHQILNAKHHQKEAEIIAKAGESGVVTIATNMAGRGTDIKLSEKAKKAGGLAIVGTERHESRRVDRQLRGRAGRQGDPGSSQFFVALEDDLMRLFGSYRIANIMDKMGMKEGEVIQHRMVTKSIEKAQKKIEEDNFAIRKRLLEYDNVMNIQRSVIYKKRQNILQGEGIELNVINAIYEILQDIVNTAKQDNNYESLKINLISIFGIELETSEQTFENTEAKHLAEALYKQALTAYKKKLTELETPTQIYLNNIKLGKSITVIAIFNDNKGLFVTLPIPEDSSIIDESFVKKLIHTTEQKIILTAIDKYWKEYLRELDELKQSVQNAVYEQKDPLLIYKLEAFDAFKKFTQQLNKYIVESLFGIVSFRPVLKITEKHLKAMEGSLKNSNLSEVNYQNQLATDKLGDPSKAAYNLSARELALEKNLQTLGIANNTAIKIPRNQKVIVKYPDGKIKKNVKYKYIEEDLLTNKCILVNE